MRIVGGYKLCRGGCRDLGQTRLPRRKYASDYRTNNFQDYIEHHAFPGFVHDIATDETGYQPKTIHAKHDILEAIHPRKLPTIANEGNRLGE